MGLFLSVEEFRERYRDVPQLFHGTNAKYVAGMRHGAYKHENGKPVFLTDVPSDAIHFAQLRAGEWNSDPAVLVIETRLILPRLQKKFFRQPALDFLLSNDYTAAVSGLVVESDVVRDVCRQLGYHTPR